jgi:CRP-like cAMP-binding protein/Zn-dependent protease/multisubunit Na+/H+ antiporter MnhG subunit
VTAGRTTSGLWRTLSDRVAEEPSDGQGGFWDDLAQRVDPAEFRPKLAADVEVKQFSLRWGNDYALVANPRDLLHYRIEPGDVELLSLMDGSRTVRQIVVERFRESGDLELSGVADLVQNLRVGNFLEPSFVDSGGAVRRAIASDSAARTTTRQFVKTLSIEWTGAHRLVAWFYRHGLRWFFKQWVAWTVGLIAITGFVAFVVVFRSGRFGISAASAAAASLVILALNYFLTFTHELAHATVLVHNGRRVKSAGFMIYFGAPAFFVDSSDGLMMERRDRIVQAFAGPYAELIIAGAAATIVWAFPGSVVAPLLYKFALLNYFVIFLNLVPLLELDGYWILSDLIQVPDLRPMSLQFIRFDLWRKLRTREPFSKQEVGLSLYGTLGVAFTVLAVGWSFFFWREIFGSLVGELWNAGVLGRFLLLALAVFVTGPLLRGLIELARALLRRLRAVWEQIRFRLETSWRVEAANLIDRLPILEDLPEDVLSDLAGRVRLRAFPAGKSVVRQGDRAQAFYVVRRGTLQVVEEDRATGDRRVLRVLGPGESFGELGLSEAAPRSATVEVIEDAQLFEIDKSTFERLLADMIHVPEFAPTLEAVAELRVIPAFAALEPDALNEILEHGRWVNVAPGEAILEQGEEGDAFYAISSGRVDVVQDGTFVRTLGPGAHFGEIALLEKVPRTAGVVARTPVRAFRLDRDGFDGLMAGAFRKGTLKPSSNVERTWQH